MIQRQPSHVVRRPCLPASLAHRPQPQRHSLHRWAEGFCNPLRPVCPAACRPQRTHRRRIRPSQARHPSSRSPLPPPTHLQPPDSRHQPSRPSATPAHPRHRQLPPPPQPHQAPLPRRPHRRRLQSAVRQRRQHPRRRRKPQQPLHRWSLRLLFRSVMCRCGWRPATQR